MEKNFDVVKKIIELTGRVAALEAGPPLITTAEPDLPNLYLGGEFSERLHLALAKAGYLTRGDLRATSDEELRRVEGVGPATLEKIRTALA